MGDQTLFFSSTLVASPGETYSPGGLLISGGTILFAGDRQRADLFASRGTKRVEFPGTVMFPGFVNAHTHLAIPDLGDDAGGDFVGWLLRVMSWRMGVGEKELAGNMKEAARQCAECGITAVGDISSGHPSLYDGIPLRIRAYAELLGMEKERWSESRENGLSFLEHLSDGDEQLAPGISPHSLYALCREGLNWAGNMSRERQIPLQIHLAESTAEMEFITRASGEMEERIFSALSLGMGGFNGYGDDFLSVVTEALERGSSLVHMTQLLESQLHTLGEKGYNFIFCIRSNRFLTGGVPLTSIVVDGGYPYSLGTDSRASCSFIDMFEEIRAFADTYHGRFRSDQLYPSLFKAATEGGAVATGFSPRVGRLEEGKLADFCIVETEGRVKNVFSWLVERCAKANVVETFVGGKSLLSL